MFEVHFVGDLKSISHARLFSTLLSSKMIQSIRFNKALVPMLKGNLPTRRANGEQLILKAMEAVRKGNSRLSAV
ncbi:hypothetical protein EUGRSUZ_D01187 [Eucalyptus grandis]|uniref:Uncharacterized protein n=2 Tax=Eucalyptus grandis TaxID=71139 RepID=A0ACC3L530_EUCGR|nr:hypothetical protein EUGRSUZ_D01187 [Eucalyptus grandis]